MQVHLKIKAHTTFQDLFLDDICHKQNYSFFSKVNKQTKKGRCISEKFKGFDK